MSARLTRTQLAHLFLWVLVGTLILWLLTGCTSRQQRQDIADSVEGQKAAASATRQYGEAMAKLGQDAKPLIDIITILAGSTAHTHAIAEGASLPAPSISAEDILRDPPTYQKHGEDAKAAGDATPGALTYIGGGLLALLGIARLMPGPTQAIAETLWGVFSTRASKKQQAAVEDGHATAGFLLDVVHAMPANSSIGELRARIATSTAAPVVSALDRWARENPADHVLSGVVPVVSQTVTMAEPPRG